MSNRHNSQDHQAAVQTRTAQDSKKELLLRLLALMKRVLLLLLPRVGEVRQKEKTFAHPLEQQQSTPRISLGALCCRPRRHRSTTLRLPSCSTLAHLRRSTPQSPPRRQSEHCSKSVFPGCKCTNPSLYRLLRTSAWLLAGAEAVVPVAEKEGAVEVWHTLWFCSLCKRRALLG